MTTYMVVCWPEPGRKRRTVAVVLADVEYRGPMFFQEPLTRPPSGIYRFIRLWKNVYVGRTQRSGFFQAHSEASAVAANLRSQADAERLRALEVSYGG